MTPPTEFFTISRVCELTGADSGRLELIEEELGEHLEVRRTRAGNRLFTQADVARLQEVLRLLDDDGLDMEQVRATLFPPPPAPAVEEEPGPATPASRTAAASPADTQPGVPSLEDGAPAEDIPHPEGDGEITVPPLPVEPTMDLLLEAAEGLVQENLRLKAAVDSLGERCLRLEERLEEMAKGRSRWRFLRRV